MHAKHDRIADLTDYQVGRTGSCAAIEPPDHPTSSASMMKGDLVEVVAGARVEPACDYLHDRAVVDVHRIRHCAEHYLFIRLPFPAARQRPYR